MSDRIGFGPRLGAFAIDVVVLLVLGWLAGVVTEQIAMNFGQGTSDADARQRVGIWFLLLLAPSSLMIAYTSLEAFFGAAVGKRMLGLRVATANGFVAPARTRAIRWAMKYSPLIVLSLWLACFAVFGAARGPGGLSALIAIQYVVLGIAGLLALAVLVGSILALGTSRLALHDRIAGTAVYRAADVRAGGAAFEAVIDGGAMPFASPPRLDEGV